MLTLTQLSSNGSRIWLNRNELRWPLIGWFALGAVPCAVAGGLLLAHAPLSALKRLLGMFLIGVVIWRRVHRQPRAPTDPAFAAVGAASGLGSALLGSVGPLTGDLLTGQVLLYGIALTPATLLGAWAGKKIVDRTNDRVLVLIVEIGLLVAGTLFLIG